MSRMNVEHYIKDNSTFFNEPLIQTFLNQEDHYDLLKRTIEENDLESSCLLDKRFERFYLKVRMIHYMDKLARYYTKSYDKKMRKHRSELTFDCLMNDEESEEVAAGSFQTDDLIPSYITDLLPSSKQKDCFLSFSDQKKQILSLSIIYEYNHKEIAKKLNCSPQNVSKTKKRALIQLREEYANG
ncbi:sigma-70 family RNA polymerase sigma factor [Alkalicoccobacillus murimartini]|uniref:RNA polymerase sigma factor (Sigma-70 family) n=1 Tax=Alkalicoccobacillus murimartini TaxID=171685 RepID=A0ABT9YIX0_9BACI|nr:sigma-70 family RNA polymerase sigma factor [Alkalicoccobacillus murimartini]MDQ0207639.1 RNA polymerase sigma factor (sigma-70 family) [Alkalicoccobacillus murimartini]